MSSELRSTTPLRRHTHHRTIAFSEPTAEDLAHRVDDFIEQYDHRVIALTAYVSSPENHHALLSYEETR